MNGKPVHGEGWLNPALLRWQWRRHRWLNLFALILSMGILAVLFLNSLKELPWSGNIVTLGVIVAGTSGLTAVRDTAGAFLLTLPVSRWQIFNTLVLGTLVPWLLLAVIPAVFALVVSSGRAIASPSHFLNAPAAFYLVFLLWTLTFYMASVYQGCYVFTHGFSFEPKPKAARPAHFLSIIWLLVMGLFFTGDRVWASHQVIAVVSACGPALAVLSLLLAVLSYRAGWRLFRTLEF
ncbi:MAG TPA: hypothetical protein VMW83_15015 [Spirochaetia bacterium]|nr:hypothetical protein [Spirochaetia bacterium]